MNDATTIRMANQIASFFKVYPRAEALREIANHINRFWEPSMRRDFFTLLAAGGGGLDPLVKEAAKQVHRPDEAHHEIEPHDAHTGLPREAHEA